jgi:hypothetical protein
MTKRTETLVHHTSKWGLFRFDVETFDDTTVLQGNWYENELNVNIALSKIKKNLPISLQYTIIKKEVAISPADQSKIYEYAIP